MQQGAVNILRLWCTVFRAVCVSHMHTGPAQEATANRDLHVKGANCGVAVYIWYKLSLCKTGTEKGWVCTTGWAYTPNSTVPGFLFFTKAAAVDSLRHRYQSIKTLSCTVSGVL